MTQPEETPVSFIPPNFIEKGKILNGTFDIRNAIESIVLSLAIGIPVFHLPLSLTARIIILCMTALPAAMVREFKKAPDKDGIPFPFPPEGIRLAEYPAEILLLQKTDKFFPGETHASPAF